VGLAHVCFKLGLAKLSLGGPESTCVFLTMLSLFVLEPYKLQVLVMVLVVLVIVHRMCRVSDLFLLYVELILLNMSLCLSIVPFVCWILFLERVHVRRTGKPVARHSLEK
jgi:hypothetical protein